MVVREAGGLAVRVRFPAARPIFTQIGKIPYIKSANNLDSSNFKRENK